MGVAAAMRIMPAVIFLAVLIVGDAWVSERVPMKVISRGGDQFI